MSKITEEEKRQGIVKKYTFGDMKKEIVEALKADKDFRTSIIEGLRAALEEDNK